MSSVLRNNKNSIVRFREIIGEMQNPLRSDDYKSSFQHPIIKYMNSIGPCFYMIGDAVTLGFLKVSTGCKEVIGYTGSDVTQWGTDFYFHFVHPEDQEGCMQMIRTAWEYLQGLSIQDKLNYVSNFYYRGIKRDGTVINVQHQVINLETDQNGNILLVCNFITDISHLNFSKEVKLVLVNSQENSILNFHIQNLKLSIRNTSLSKRELEIIKLMVAGLSSRQIADRLNISFYTARTHRKNILEKLGKKNTAEMIGYAISNGLVH